MKLHRDLGVTQKTAWFMLHRIREAWSVADDHGSFTGPVEVDETYFGGKRKNMSNAKREELAGTGRGPVGKTAVVGAKDRATNRVAAEVVRSTDSETLQGFVKDHADADATVYTDDASRLRFAALQARDGQALRDRIRPGQGSHERSRILLVNAEASPQRDVPQDQPQAPEPIRAGVRG